MNNTKTIIAIMALVAVAFMAQPALARGGGQNWNAQAQNCQNWNPQAQNGPNRTPQMVNGPNCQQTWNGFQNSLTPEKQQAVAKLIQDNNKARFDLRQKIWAKNTELRAVMSAQNPDQKAVKDLTSEIVSLRTQMYDQQQAFRGTLEKETSYDFTSGNMRGQSPKNFSNCNYANAGKGGKFSGKNGMGRGAVNCPGYY